MNNESKLFINRRARIRFLWLRGATRPVGLLSNLNNYTALCNTVYNDCNVYSTSSGNEGSRVEMKAPHVYIICYFAQSSKVYICECAYCNNEDTGMEVVKMEMNDVINVVKNAIDQVNMEWKNDIRTEINLRNVYEKNGWIFFDIGAENEDKNMLLTRRTVSAIVQELIALCRSAGVQVSAIKYRDLYLNGQKIRLGVFSLIMKKKSKVEELVNEIEKKLKEIRELAKQIKDLSEEEKNQLRLELYNTLQSFLPSATAYKKIKPDEWEQVKDTLARLLLFP